MKKILTIISMTIMAISLHAQETTLQNVEQEDSTIAVIAYFCKDDTMEYLRRQGKYKVVGNDTTDMGNITEKFRIAVTDSTSEGYKMEITPISMEVEGGENNYVIKMAQLLWNDLKNLRCRFSTDELGRVQHIENWREIRDVLKKSYVLVFDSLYTSIPGLDSVMPRKQMEGLIRLGSSTEDGIKEQYDELEMLFGMHGNEVNMESVESDDISEAGYPTHTLVESFYSAQTDEYDREGDYVIQARTDTKISFDDMTDLMSSTFGVLFTGEASDSINKYVNMALEEKKEGMTVSNHEQYCYSYNGWPKLMQKVTEIDIAGLAKRIEYDSIEWTFRRWGVFTFPEEEDKEKDL